MLQDFTKGIFKNNPIFVTVLGLCPTLAVTTSLNNALGMGAAVIFVLAFSNTMISSIKGFVPRQIRIPCFIVVIASFVTIVELVMKAYAPALSRQLGIFVPLIVVNCIILGRAEAFASRNSAVRSMLDGLGSGVGFFCSLLVISFIREALGTGTVFGFEPPFNFHPASIMILAPGALLTMGLLLAIINSWKIKRGGKAKETTGCH
ncbi:MAG: electron transport complex subunit E [Candidatus Omnitrophica bacterium]|nr:electron transport complex subunit E [Candidatus Omnitrophota bacterium]